ncbi:sialic acid-binding Ig-like lectin 14 [Pipistrellus kuhlii]|uniref:sialic acid-binding Ig-like lectin 14 n=1 Tax=Pipistrellus kuhlii TaxID=59472 RepID=UPI001E2742C4|nr:sialic acid-binding Ig-like lectin 14 [Pipistrellus kuhlii]
MVPLLFLLFLLWGGSLEEQPGFELQVQESVTVQEGLCVHVPCSFSYPWSSSSSSTELYTYWFSKEDSVWYDSPVASKDPNRPAKTATQGRFLLMDTTNNNCSLQIRDSQRSDTGTYMFRMERGSVKYSYQEKMLKLQVTALTEKPHIQIREPLESGRPTQLACSLPGACEGGRPLTLSWAGAAVDSLDPRNLSSSVLTFIPRPGDHGTNLTCQVKLEWPQLTTQRTIQLNVSYVPRNLTIGVTFRNATARPGQCGSEVELRPRNQEVTAFKILQATSLTILEGEALRLLCVADSNPPAELSWFWGSPGLNATPISRTAILELPRVGPAQEGNFTCQAQHPLGSQNVSLSLFVIYPPQLLGPFCFWEDQGLHCSCSARAQPAPSLHWRLGAGLLEGNHGNATHVVTSSSEGPWTNSSLSLREGLSPELRLSCEAQNVHGAHRASILLLPGQGLLGAEAITEKGVGQRAGGAWGGGCGLDRSYCWHRACISCLNEPAVGYGWRWEEERPSLGSGCLMPLFSAEKSVFQVGVALGGAGALALLSLCLCLISFCRVKALRRQAAGRPKVTDDEDPVMSTVTWGSKRNLGLDKPPNQGLPTEDPPLSEEQWEVYYGNLSFHGMKPQGPEDPDANSSINEYSEI